MKRDTQENRTADLAISVDGLIKEFGDGDDAVRAVDGVSFGVERGSVVGLLGPNGAGKTTTIKCLLGLIVPDEGTVEIGGVDVYESQRRVHGRVGAILEGARNIYWRLTVRENLEFFAGLGGDMPSELRERHDRLLEQFDLLEYADTTVKELSRGMQQKVSLVSTLARDVDVVFLDEPTLGLDVETSLQLRRELRSLARREGITIVLSSHDMEVIESVCDRVVVLGDGSVVADDEVESLIDVFQTHKYRIDVEGTVDESTRRRLRDRTQVTFEPMESQTRIEFHAEEDATVYDIFDTLETGDHSLAGIDSLEPDFEDIFLELTDTEPVGDRAEQASTAPVEADR